MKIALALPPKQRLAQDQFHRTPQCGIGYIAGGLRKDGLNVTVYNSKYENIKENDLTDYLINGNYDVIGFSAMTFEIKTAGRIAQHIKSVNKNCKIMIGGCHVNAIPKETMEEFPHFDLACIGEHEDQISTICQLLHDSDFDSLEKINNIVFRKNNELHYNDLNRRFIKDVNTIAWPAYDLFGSKSLNPAYISSRGCPFGCSFCQQNSGRVIRKRNPIDVCDEIEYFSKMFDQQVFTFRDESFTANKEQTISVCNELIKRGLNRKLKWTCETHSRVADYEVFCLMKEAGCYYVDIGIESGSDQILKATAKSTTVETIKKAVTMVRKANMKVGGLFILGHPFETKRTMLSTVALGVRMNPDSITFSMMTPFPGTKVYEYASNRQAGLRLLTKNWDMYDNIRGYAMAWDNFSVTTLKIMQAIGLVSYHLFNLRICQFAEYLNRHKKGIAAYFLSIFKKANPKNNLENQ